MAKHKKKKKITRYYLLILLLIFGLVLAGALFMFRYIQNYNVVCDPNNTEYYTITVSSGMTGKSIATMLEEEGIIDSAKRFSKKAQLIGVSSLFQAGEYQLSPSMSTDEIYDALQHARRETVSFTVPEGYTLKQVGEKLAEDGIVSSAADFYAALEDDYDYWFIPEGQYADPTGTISVKGNRLEGYLAPNTYEVFADADAHDIIDKMLSGFDNIYTDDLKARAEELGLSTQEVVTIASMIEGETKVDLEREKVSSVIYNRLKINMKLQLDACIQYCLGEHKDRVLYSDLEIDSPYNTYIVDGLPAGPICSPRAASIEAALYPAETDYIYYVLKPDNSGEHNFAETAEEFNTYKQQYLNSL